MAEQRDVADRLERGKRCIEQMCGRRHDIADMYWDRYEVKLRLTHIPFRKSGTFQKKLL